MIYKFKSETYFIYCIILNNTVITFTQAKEMNATHPELSNTFLI